MKSERAIMPQPRGEEDDDECQALNCVMIVLGWMIVQESLQACGREVSRRLTDWPTVSFSVLKVIITISSFLQVELLRKVTMLMTTLSN